MLGKADLDQLLAERERLNEDLQRIIDEQTEPWGVKVTTVEIKDVEIPAQMQRRDGAARPRPRGAAGEDHRGRGGASGGRKLSQAADIISRNPATLQLRYLQTLLEMGMNQNTTIVFPLPIELIRTFQKFVPES